MDLNSLDTFDNQTYKLFTGKAVIEKDLTTLLGYLDGIMCDKDINPSELLGIHTWIQSCEKMVAVQPYKSIIEALLNAIEDNVITTEEKMDIEWICSKYFEDKSPFYTGITQGLQELNAIVKGITIDSIINERELKYIDNWIAKHSYLKSCWPYDELDAFTTKILADSAITCKELDEFSIFCKTLCNDNHSNIDIIQLLQNGYCHSDPEIIIEDRMFCITGISKKYKRREIAEKIELFGGYVNNSVSMTHHYLIVCEDKNSAWAYSAYGRKIEKALTNRKKGSNIAIVHENDLYDTLESLN